MIQLIGAKRAVIFGILLAVNLALAAAFFMAVGPMLADATTRLNVVNSEISRLTGDIENAKREAEELKKNLPHFNDLQARGFFLNQDRFMINRTLDELRTKSGVSGFSFNIDAMAKVGNAQAEAAQYQLTSSRIKIDKIETLTDADFFILLQNIVKAFPAHARVQSFELKRSAKIDEAALQRLARKEVVNFSEGEIVMDWLTMLEVKIDPQTGLPIDPLAPPVNPGGFRGQ